jgi:hypothetical protein|tara:strand:- start:1723 stop:1902 length:180 start_codon:yes stop_codon:yes gene_type:complete
MTLTNILLFLILVTMAAYTFMPWQGIAKGSWTTLILYWLGFFAFFAAALTILSKLNLII